MDFGDGQFLKDRAEQFLENGTDLLEQGVHDLAAFNFEQAAQLLLRYHFFQELENFPQTHSLQDLIVAIGKASRNTGETETFLNEHEEVVNALESAYLTSRVLPGEFKRSEVEEMAEFLVELKEFVE